MLLYGAAVIYYDCYTSLGSLLTPEVFSWSRHHGCHWDASIVCTKRSIRLNIIPKASQMRENCH